MKAELLYKRRIDFGDGAFVEAVVWSLSVPVRGSAHRYKYRLALVANDECVMRFDNEAGNGDHKHFGDEQEGYAFQSLERLEADFLADIEIWLKHRNGP